MPRIQINDNGNIKYDISPSTTSAIAKYVRQELITLRPNPETLRFFSKPLNKVKLTSAGGSFGVEQAFPMGSGPVDELEVGAGTEIELSVKASGALFDDEFGDPVEVPEARAYVGLGFGARVSAGLSRELRSITFGFANSSTMRLATYLPFDAELKFSEAAQQVLNGFEIPGDVMDLDRLPAGAVCTASGNGTFEFSAEVALTNTLSAVALDIPLGLGKIKGQVGGSVTVGAGFTLTGDYQVRAHKQAEDRVVLSFGRQKGREFTISADARWGVTSRRERGDLIASVFRIFEADLDPARAVEQGLMSEDQADEIRAAVKQGIQRTLEFSIGYQFAQMQETGDFFRFSFNPKKLTKAAQLAVNRALDGDVTSILELVDSPAHGIVIERSLARTIEQSTHTWRINVLGIFNYISLEKMLLEGRILYEPETGSLTVTDQATATRVRALTANYEADPEKLRHLLAEQCVATAAYQATGLYTGMSLTCQHVFTKTDSDTSWEEMKDFLDAAEGLQLVDAPEKEELLAAAPRFGRTTCCYWMESDDAVSSRLFLQQDSGARLVPRPESAYRAAAQQALRQIVRRGDRDDYRLKILAPAVWKGLSDRPARDSAMRYLQREIGMSLNESAVAAADWFFIATWAAAMAKASEEIAAMRDLLPTLPTPLDPADERFESRRRSVASRLKEAVKRTREHFGEPFGLLALDFAAHQSGSARFQLQSGRVNKALAKQRAAKEIAAAAGG